MGGNHILIVDDEERLVNMMDFLLVKNGYKVSTALSGEDAFIKAKKAHEQGCGIDLLITDIFLPGMTGAQLIDELENAGIKMKILAISGEIKEWGNSELAGKKLNGYLPKPFGPMQLVEEIKEIMKGKELTHRTTSVS